MVDGFDSGFEGTRRRQARQALAMTHLERLRWLEAKREELLRLLGRARVAARGSRTVTEDGTGGGAAGQPSG
jgi:hypothetical protein